MDQKTHTIVVTNYYRANNALSEIGMCKDIPEELKEIVLEASRATIKIIDYINNHKEI